MHTNKSLEIVKNAYRKVKSQAYFDKTQAHLKMQIIDFEHQFNSNEELENFFEDLKNRIFNKPNIENFNDLIKQIAYLIFPKKIDNCQLSDDNISTNIPISNSIKITDYQAFIVLPIQLHILSMIWCMTIGSKIDSMFSDDIYGNRIKKNFQEEKMSIGKSPYLFKPYFEQYETWRDKGINRLEEELKRNASVVMINIDLSRFYYQVDLEEIDFLTKYETRYPEIKYTSDSVLSEETRIVLNQLIYTIMQSYTNKLKEIDERIVSNCILPLGFYPSMILSNLYLLEFDNEIQNSKPLYYGRYVDDIFLVYKVYEVKNIENEICEFSKNKDNQNKKSELLPKLLNKLYCMHLDKDFIKWEYFEKLSNKNITYNLNNENKKLHFSISKAKVMYFSPEYSYKMIEEFKQHLWQNKSEFRLAPEDIFEVQYSKLTKLKGGVKIENLKKEPIDKFELSKFISKNIHISRDMNVSEVNSNLDSLMELIDGSILFEIYHLWESIITLFILTKRFDLINEFMIRIVSGYENRFTYGFDFKEKNEILRENMKQSVKEHLYISASRAFSIISNFDQTLVKSYQSMNLLYKNFNDLGPLHTEIKVKSHLFRSYNMTNKTFISIIPELLSKIDKQKKDEIIEIFNINVLVNFLNKNSHIIKILEGTPNQNDRYYLLPYNVSLYDIQFIKLLLRIKSNSWEIENSEIDVLCRFWAPVNGYDLHEDIELGLKDRIIYKQDKGKICKRIFTYNENDYIHDPYVGIGNVRIEEPENYFDRVRQNNLNISNQRYNNLSETINTVLRFTDKGNRKTNIFLLPEGYVPLAWVPMLVSVAKKNDMAIIAGIEHFKITYKQEEQEEKYYNFIVSIFPIKINNYIMVNVNFHLKVHCSPIELLELNNKQVSGNLYEMHKWRGMNIAPYCCYELTSINDRSLFKENNVNVIAAIVYNRDVNYFSNIIESLSRDLNCFVLQANDASYGDSRIFQPTKGYYKNIMRFTGGINYTALISKLELSELKKHLRKPILVQYNDRKWKTESPK